MILKHREEEKCTLCPSTFFFACLFLLSFFYCRGLFLLTGDTHRIDMAFANNVCAREMLFLLVNFFFGSRWENCSFLKGINYSSLCK